PQTPAPSTRRSARMLQGRSTSQAAGTGRHPSTRLAGRRTRGPAAVVAAVTACLLAAPAPAPAAVAEDAPAYEWGGVAITGGGYVPGIVYNPTEPGLVYARTDIGGAYRLDRDADRWVPLLDHVGW